MSALKTKWKKELLEWLVAVGIGIAIVAFIRSTFLTTYHIEGDSMLPSLHSRDQVVVLRHTSIDRGDIVILKRPNESDIVKRVIGLPGDQIQFIQNEIYINGTKLNEAYIEGQEFQLDEKSFEVGQNAYFILGDNREKSLDSRQLGEFDTNRLVGEVKMIYFPLQHFNWLTY